MLAGHEHRLDPVYKALRFRPPLFVAGAVLVLNVVRHRSWARTRHANHPLDSRYTEGRRPRTGRIERNPRRAPDRIRSRGSGLGPSVVFVRNPRRTAFPQTAPPARDGARAWTPLPRALPAP